MKIDKQTLFIIGTIGLIGAYYMTKHLTIRINRYLLTDDKTVGKMYLNNEYFCDTLEDTYRGQELSNTKVYGATAIPNGNYKCKLTFSPNLNNYYPELFNVPYFTNIRIHTGSSTQDTNGCILVGDYKDGKWFANGSYVQKLRALLPTYISCDCIVNII